MYEKFYFTFGTKGQPFVGGWVEIWAKSRKKAIEVFRKKHPDKTPCLINCADIYTEEEFQKTGMEKGNLGAKCHAVYHESAGFKDDFLTIRNDEIYNAVFSAIFSVAHVGSKPDWDMSIIGEAADFIKDLLVKRGVGTCYPWQDENETLCFESERRCAYCSERRPPWILESLR